MKINPGRAVQNVRVSNDRACAHPTNRADSYQGKLPTTGRRPRFRLPAAQARNVSTLLEVDGALAAAGIDPAWLNRRSDEMPRSPLALMRAGATNEVLRSLTRVTLQASVAQARKSKRPPRRLARGD